MNRWWDEDRIGTICPALPGFRQSVRKRKGDSLCRLLLPDRSQGRERIS